MEVSPFAIVYSGTKIFVRCSEMSVVKRCPLMEVPLYNINSVQARPSSRLQDHDSTGSLTLFQHRQTIIIDALS